MSSSSSDISVSAAAAPMAAPVLEQRVFLPHEQFEPHDAKGTFVKGADFQELYYAARNIFNEDDEDSLCFCKNMRIHEAGSYGGFCPRGVDLIGHVNDPTLWDAYIRKVSHAGHGDSVMEIGAQLGNYAEEMRRRYPSYPKISSGGGFIRCNEVGDEDGNVHPEMLVDPDCAMKFKIHDDFEPRVIIEVEFSNRSPLKLSEHAHSLMNAKENLRCVIGLKIYPRNGKNQPFAAVCFVWKKRPDNNQIYVDRVFDFGPRASFMAIHDIANFWTDNHVDFTNVQNPNDATQFLVTPVPAPGFTYDVHLQGNFPTDWQDIAVRRHCIVSIAMSDVYYGHNPTPIEEEGVAQEDQQTDLEIDLYKVLFEIDDYKAKNFSHPSTQN